MANVLTGDRGIVGVGINGRDFLAEITILAFAVTALIGIATPGPTVLLALTNGARFGVRRSIPGMFGAVLSDFLLIGAVALGLGALLLASEFWFSVVKWIGVAYLAYLGVMLLRSEGMLKAPKGGFTDHDSRSVRSIFLKSFLVAITNPKGYLFFSALLPQFITASEPQLPQYIALALVFATIDFMVMFAYAVFGSRATLTLTTAGVRWLNRICGGTFLVLAGSVAVIKRTDG